MKTQRQIIPTHPEHHYTSAPQKNGCPGKDQPAASGQDQCPFLYLLGRNLHLLRRQARSEARISTCKMREMPLLAALAATRGLLAFCQWLLSSAARIAPQKWNAPIFRRLATPENCPAKTWDPWREIQDLRNGIGDPQSKASRRLSQEEARKFLEENLYRDPSLVPNT